jgi:hypothetical protein
VLQKSQKAQRPIFRWHQGDRCAGRPLWVIRDWVEPATKLDHVGYAPKADKSPHRGETSRRADFVEKGLQ